MTIRNFAALKEATWDYSMFQGCFGDSRITVSDVDGIVERNGFYFILEVKSEGVETPLGQQIIFESMIKWNELIGFMLPIFTVVSVWGPHDTVREMRIWNKQDTQVRSTNQDLKDLMTRWYQMADKYRFYKDSTGVIRCVKKQRSLMDRMDWSNTVEEIFKDHR